MTPLKFNCVLTVPNVFNVWSLATPTIVILSYLSIFASRILSGFMIESSAAESMMQFNFSFEIENWISVVIFVFVIFNFVSDCCKILAGFILSCRILPVKYSECSSFLDFLR